jgi:hypothetical protein
MQAGDYLLRPRKLMQRSTRARGNKLKLNYFQSETHAFQAALHKP